MHTINCTCNMYRLGLRIGGTNGAHPLRSCPGRRPRGNRPRSSSHLLDQRRTRRFFALWIAHRNWSTHAFRWQSSNGRLQRDGNSNTHVQSLHLDKIGIHSNHWPASSGGIQLLQQQRRHSECHHSFLWRHCLDGRTQLAQFLHRIANLFPNQISNIRNQALFSDIFLHFYCTELSIPE